MPFRNPPMSMWAEACEILDRAENLRRQFYQPSRVASWEPPIDVYETERDLWIVVALPGVGADQFRIAVSDGVVIVAGERRLPIQSRAVIHRLEIPHGSFERRIKLPAGRYEMDRRDLADGCLILGLHKLS
jgi:HSP20 family molecular chaperone IbpA